MAPNAAMVVDVIDYDDDDINGGANYMTSTTMTPSPRKRLSFPLRSNNVTTTTVNQSPSPATTASSIVDHTNTTETKKRTYHRRWRDYFLVVIMLVAFWSTLWTASTSRGSGGGGEDLVAKTPSTYNNAAKLSLIPSSRTHHHSPMTATTSIATTRTIIERRGGGLLTTHTACRISLWIWYSVDGKIPNKPKLNQLCDTIKHQGQHVGHQLRNVNDLRSYDTIFVPFTSLNDFVTTILPHITVNIVIISGHPFNVAPPSSTNIQELVHHKHVIAWFCQNIPKYGGGSNPTLATHTKIIPFPYGLNEKDNKLGLRTYPAYKKILFDGLRNETTTTTTSTAATSNGRNNNRKSNNKSIFIYAGPLKTVETKATSKSGVVVVNDSSTSTSITTSKKASDKDNIIGGDGRRNIPGSKTHTEYKKERLLPIDYFTNMYNSRYILSPNGDRPECFRHYEAIGLGSIPITELDTTYQHFRHLIHGPVIYNNHVWNITLLEQTLDPYPIVNRNLIREDYWMQWMEGQIGGNVRLTWNDRLRVPSSAVVDDDNNHDEENDEDNGMEKKEDDHRNSKRYHNGLTDEENELLTLLDYV